MIGLDVLKGVDIGGNKLEYKHAVVSPLHVLLFIALELFFFFTQLIRFLQNLVHISRVIDVHAGILELDFFDIINVVVDIRIVILLGQDRFFVEVRVPIHADFRF